MRRVILRGPLLVGLLLGVLAVPAAALADDDGRGGRGGDRAFCAPAGTPVSGQCSFLSGQARFDFDARSGPRGQNPRGSFVQQSRFLRLEVDVTCLQVTGARAAVGGLITSASNPALVGTGYAFTVLDNSPATDLISLGTLLPAPPSPTTPNCGDTSQPVNPVQGDLVVREGMGGGGRNDDDE